MHKYDIFISYSHTDREWVWNKLLPRLEEAGLEVIIDDRDFEIGVPSLVNMERAVDNSRHTLMVLTPAWLKSDWTEFEELLTQTADPAGRRRKLIPLMLKRCELPRRIAMLTYADFKDPLQFDAQMARLLKSIGSPGSPPPPPGSAPESRDDGLALSDVEVPNDLPDEEQESTSSKFDKLGHGPNLSEKIIRILSNPGLHGSVAIVGVIVGIVACIAALAVVPEVRQRFGMERPTPLPTLTVAASPIPAATPTSMPEETPAFTPDSIVTNTPALVDTPTSTDVITPTAVTSIITATDGSDAVIILTDENSLTGYVPANVAASLLDLNLEYRTIGGEEKYFFANSDGFVSYVDGTIPPPFCLHLERASNPAPFPLECQSVHKPTVKLPDGSVFWWDEFGKSTKTLFVNLGVERLGVCDAGFSRCSIEIP